MSAPTPARESARGQRHRLTGTGTLLWFMLRRDRLRFPAWTLGLAVLMAYFANALGTVYDQAALQGIVEFSANPVVSLLGGPGFGFADITLPRFLVGQYGLYLILAAALMSILTVSRHTRVEEQTGRAELIRANVVGRDAQLTAALLVAVTMNVVAAALMGAVLLTSTMDPEPASSVWLFVAGIGAGGIAFAGVAAVTVQLSPFSRAASGAAGAILGAAFVLRGLGDMSATQGGDLGWLSWLSPIGWSQQTAPFTLDRWWPLLFSFALCAGSAAAGYVLQSHRDLGAGIIAPRAGAPRAAAWLRTPIALAYRLQRASLLGWSVALLLAGMAFGLFSQPVRESAGDFPEEVLAVMGGSAQLLDGYLGLMGLLFAVVVAAYVIVSLQGLRAEEQGWRTEAVLATAVGRVQWLLAWTAVTAAGALWLLLVAGTAEAIGASWSLGDRTIFLPTLLGHVAHLPAVWFVLALAALCYAITPRLLGAVWVVYVYGAFISFFGQLLELPDAALDASVFHHLGQPPLDEVSWGAVVLLSGGAFALTAVAAALFRRRDITTA